MTDFLRILNLKGILVSYEFVFPSDRGISRHLTDGVKPCFTCKNEALCFITHLTCSICETVHITRKCFLRPTSQLLLSDSCLYLQLFSLVLDITIKQTHTYIIFFLQFSKHDVPKFTVKLAIYSSLPFFVCVYLVSGLSVSFLKQCSPN